jgi:hypothetical protein
MSITITRKEACELIRSYIGKPDVKMPKGDELDKIVYAVNNDMQVRDFLLGLPKYYDMQEVLDFLQHMCAEAPTKEDIPFFTVISALAYETGNGAEFFKHMGYVLVHDPKYSLAAILAKCAASGYPGTMLTKMREDLHAKVMQACYTEEPDHVIKESENNDGEHVPTFPNLSTSSEDSGQQTSGETTSGSTTNTQSQSGSN